MARIAMVCSDTHQRGDLVCENAALVRRDELEHGLLKRAC